MTENTTWNVLFLCLRGLQQNSDLRYTGENYTTMYRSKARSANL